MRKQDSSYAVTCNISVCCGMLLRAEISRWSVCAAFIYNCHQI